MSRNQPETPVAFPRLDLRTLSHLAHALDALGRREDAATAWLNLSQALQARSHFEEARDAYREALARNATSIKALVELGAVHLRLGEPQEAVPLLERAISLDPEDNSAHVLLSRACHLLGDVTRGFKEFAWLTHPRTVQWRAFEQPMWDGSALSGRTILLWTRPRSGLGDAIQYLRYLPLVRDRGGTVVFECHPDLVHLAGRMPGIDSIVAQGDPLPSFDLHAPLPRLPIVLNDVPWPLPMGSPYVSVRDELVNRWRQSLAGDNRLKIGLVWAGEPRRPDAQIRFAPLAAFACLGRIANAHLISLQVEPQIDELKVSPEYLHVTRLPLTLSTPLEEKAAVVMNLDLVITVDTMMAHLAGALGRKVWTVLPFAADWRWLQGETTAWYPTMRLFRQPKAGDWNGAMTRVVAALEESSIQLRRNGERMRDDLRRG